MPINRIGLDNRAPKFQGTSPVVAEISAGQVRTFFGSGDRLKTMVLSAVSGASYRTKNRQYLWFVKECVEGTCPSVSIQRPWAPSTEVNFEGNPTFGLLVVDGNDWNVVYQRAEALPEPSASPAPKPTPSPIEGVLLKLYAEKYLFSPVRHEKGSVSFELSAPSDVEISMYDRTGTKLMSLANATFTAGKHSVYWDGKDESGRVVAPGAYSGRVSVNRQTRWFKLIVTR
jgi:hypothetical protein